MLAAAQRALRGPRSERLAASAPNTKRGSHARCDGAVMMIAQTVHHPNPPLEHRGPKLDEQPSRGRRPRLGHPARPGAPDALRLSFRHTTATLLLRAGVPLQDVQRILRHADIRTTISTYGHMVCEDLRASVGLLPAGPASEESEADSRAVGIADRGDGLVTEARIPQTEGPAPVGFPLGVPALGSEREKGFEPSTLSLGS